MIKKTTQISIAIASCFLLFSCGGEHTTDETVDVDTTATNEVIEPEVETFYQIPSPDEMFAFIKESGLKYNATLLNPANNAANYTDPTVQSVNFGIYAADLAYTASFEEYQSSIKYFGVVNKMGDDIGISSAFDKGMVDRIQGNLNNADSLVTITNQSYYSIISYLEESERGKTLGLMAMGGWIESMYIVTQSVANFDEANPAVERLADQKLTYENLLEYLSQHEADSGVATALSQLEKLTAVFNNIKETEVEAEKPAGGKMTLGSKNTVTKRTFTKEHFEELKKVVNSIRSSYVTVAS